MEPADFRSGYIVFLGKPNVGKSTLLNRILGQKLAIVSPKPQTTRQRVMGILSDETHQAILVDTPGLLVPHMPLHTIMLAAARNALSDADVILAIHDATRPIAEFDETLKEATRSRGSLLVALNKVDRVKKPLLLTMIEHVHAVTDGAEIVPISALDGDNVDILLGLMKAALPVGPPYYPTDVLTDQPERFFVSEIIRETILIRFSDEVPHAVQVEVERFEEAEGRKDEIDAVIHVERASQKAILIGRAGRAIKEIGIQSREAIEAFLERPVVLKLFVKVVPSWRRDPRAIRRLGLDGR